MNIAHLAGKEVAGLPLWVWVIGGVAGLYLASTLNRGNVTPTTATDTSADGVLQIGNTGDSVSACPTVQMPACLPGEQVVYSTDDAGCPVASCQPATTLNQTQTIVIRQKSDVESYDRTHVGVPVWAGVFGHIIGQAGYGIHLQTTGEPLFGPCQPLAPPAGHHCSNAWYPILFSGSPAYISGYDVVGGGGGY